MPSSFNGIGTTYYGQCDFEQDGSFVTTKWFVLGFFPCAPLGSARVRQLQSSGIPFLSRSTGYDLIEALPTNWAQVLRTWAYTIFIIAFFARIVSTNLPPLAKFLLITAAIFIPYGARAFAKWRVG